MRYTLITSLEKRFNLSQDNRDYIFEINTIKNYENLTWLNGSKPTLDQINLWIAEDNEQEAYNQLRELRNNLLSDTDWMFRSDMTPTQSLIDYCQALRDLPSTSNPILDPNGDLDLMSINIPENN